MTSQRRWWALHTRRLPAFPIPHPWSLLHDPALPWSRCVVPYNPEGCWDWWGYNGPDFAVKSAPQMVTIMNMAHALGG
jgi:hypothetical protein